MLFRWLRVLWICAVLSPLPARAAVTSAEATLERAIALSLEAEFEQALALFDELLARAELERDARVRLLSERSLVLFALGAERELDENLRTLAELAPEAELDSRAPPALLARFQALAAAQRTAQSERASAASAAPVVALASPQPERRDADSGLSPRAKRAIWISSAAAVAAAALVTALVLTLPGASEQRTAVNPSVEF